MSKSEALSAFDGLITDLTRTVDQLERAIAGDISVQVGGAVLDVRVTDAILKRSALKNSVIAGLAGAGFAYATVVLELLPLVAIEAMDKGIEPDQYLETFSALSLRLRTAAEVWRNETKPKLADIEDTIEQSPIFYADSEGGVSAGDNDEAFDENRVLATLASLGIHDVGELQQIAPGVYTGVGTMNKADAEAWGPCSEYPRNDVDENAGFGTRRFG